jgi:hypothetical protein
MALASEGEWFTDRAAHSVCSLSPEGRGLG